MNNNELLDELIDEFSNFINVVKKLAKEHEELNAKNEKYKQMFQKIKDRIELYNDCYEGTPDECIAYIKKEIEVV